MGKLPKLTQLGIPFPSADYPNPVQVARKIIHTIYEMDGLEGFNIEDLSAVEKHLETSGADEVLAWFKANKTEYERGIKDGFEVKRYRASMAFADGTEMVYREQEDLQGMKVFSAEVINALVKRGYTTQKREDKGTDIGKMLPTPDGGKVFDRFCTFYLKAIPARKLTPIEDQRYASSEDKILQNGA